MNQAAALLSVEGLVTTIPSRAGDMRPVNDISFQVDVGEIVALVGESGCGKSITALSLMGLVPPPGHVTAGHVNFRGRDLAGLSDGEMRKVRGVDLAMVFQDPVTYLNPLMTVGDQIAEAVRTHQRVSQDEAFQRAVTVLEQVRIPSPQRTATAYPHQLSGGMRQRVVIAIAIVCQPALLIADEPTTALDVTVQAQIMDLLQDLRVETGLSLLLITHDLGLVAEHSDRVYVMYAGEIVEHGTADELFAAPSHPYTEFLLASAKSIAGGTEFPTVGGHPPDLRHPPSGCRYHPRCPQVMDRCVTERPPAFGIGPASEARCWLRSDNGQPSVNNLKQQGG